MSLETKKTTRLQITETVSQIKDEDNWDNRTLDNLSL